MQLTESYYSGKQLCEITGVPASTYRYHVRDDVLGLAGTTIKTPLGKMHENTKVLREYVNKCLARPRVGAGRKRKS